MTKAVVFQEPLIRRYSAPKLSIAYIFIILCNTAGLILPIFIFNGTHGDFWIQYGKYREQPEVTFLYKFIMVLESKSMASDRTKDIFVSNIDSLNVLRPETFRLASIQFHEDDIDRDGKFDSLTLEADVPLYPDEQIQSMQVLLFFNFRLQKRVKLDMESLAYTSVESSLPIGGYDSAGTFMLRQSKPLGIRAYFSTLYAAETPLIDTDDLHANNRIMDCNIGNILEKYRSRGVVADYVERYPIKTRGRTNLSGEAGNFHLKMKMDVPEQEILYVATLMEVLKDGWIKYLSVVVVGFVLINRIKQIVFGCQL